MKKSISVCLLGIPDIGKTIHRGLLIWSLKKRKCADEVVAREMRVDNVKYPISKQIPISQRIQDYLYNNNPEQLNPLQFQKINYSNKKLFQPDLEKLLLNNDVVIIDSYIGTSIAYGMADGIDKEVLINLNAKLLKPDVTILLDGIPFERNPKKVKNVYEQDPEKIKKVRSSYLELAKEFDWHIINANQPEPDVHEKILDIVSKTFEKANRVMVPA